MSAANVGTPRACLMLGRQYLADHVGMTEHEFHRWYEHVCENVSAECGFSVRVFSLSGLDRRGKAIAHDVVGADTVQDRQAVLEAVGKLFEEYAWE